MTFYPIQGDVQYHLAGDPMQGELADGFPLDGLVAVTWVETKCASG